MSSKTRRLMWSVPLVAVFAVAGALAIFAAQMPNVAFAAPPGAPTLDSVNAMSAMQIDLSWSPASGVDAATGYMIEVSTDQAASWSELVANTRSADITYKDMGLSAGQRRHYRVSAINADGTSPPSNIENAITWSKPAAPMGLTAMAGNGADLLANGDVQIHLMWTDVPTTDGSSVISAYQVEASRSPSGPWTVLKKDIAASTEMYSHTGLMADQTWYYQVSAINSVGTGAPVTAMATTWKTPAAPTGFTAMPDSKMGHTHIKLSWSKVSAPETGGDLTDGMSYKLFATTGGADALRTLVENDALDVGTDADMVRVGFQYVATDDVRGTTVAGGQTWHFQVAANNRAGIGPRSEVRVVKTWTLPGAPTGLTATAVSKTRVDLSWTAPTDTGGQGVKITGYFIERSTNSAATWPEDLRETTTNANTTYADTNAAVAANPTVHYRVSAMNGITVNGGTTGMASNIALARALNVPAAPTKLKAAAVSGTQIDLSWKAPKDPDAAPVTGYKIEFNTAAANAQADPVWSVLEADTESTDTTHMDTTLMNGELRHYQVKAINKAGTGAASSSAMATAWNKPGAPMLLMATADGPSRIKMSWGKPDNTGGMDAEGDAIPITGYKIEVSDDLGETWSVLQASYDGDADASAEGIQYNHIGLMAGDQRHYQVSAINAVGESASSNINNATAGMAVKPSEPMMVMAMAMGHDMIKVTWGAPESDGGSAVTDYMVQRGTMGADEMMTWMDVDPAHMGMEMMYTDRGLTAKTTYYYRVAATNAKGMGDYSDGTDSAITLAAPASMELTAPTDVVVSVFLNTISVTWTPNSAQNADQIKVVLFNEGVTAISDAVDEPLVAMPPAADDGSHTYSNVPPGTYKVAVASWRAGEGHKLSPLQTVTVEVQ